MDDLISKRSTTERLVIAKTLLETVLQDMPAAEPNVIHCKECVYYENETHGLCDLGGEWAPDDYCSYGRRPKHG